MWGVVLLVSSLPACDVDRSPLFDQDGDGILQGMDCSDHDDSLGSRYLDRDGDGYGDEEQGPLAGCDQTDGWAERGGDCNDADAAVHPGAAEVCDGKDNNCNGEADGEDELTHTTFYPDGDGDGYGNNVDPMTSCDESIDGYVSNDGDCDDGNASVHPGAIEVCNGIDDNCNGEADGKDELTHTTFYPDGDGDGYGVNASSIVSCDESLDGYVSNDDDCDDGNAAIHPGAQERCNQIDDDCDGEVPGDEIDNDGDSLAECEGDCDDGDASIHPLIVDSKSQGELPDGSSGSPYPDIQSALEALNNPDQACRVIVVEDGDYDEHLDIEADDMVLRSLNGSGTTTLSGDVTSSLLRIVGRSGVEVQGFRLVFDDDGSASAPCLYLSGSSDISLNDLFLDGCTRGDDDSYGGGMEIEDSHGVEVLHTVFSGCRADYGGGMSVRSSAVTIMNSIFRANQADKGGGLSAYGNGDDAAEVSLVNCTFVDNEATEGSTPDSPSPYPGNAVYFVNLSSFTFLNSIASNKDSQEYSSEIFVGEVVPYTSLWSVEYSDLYNPNGTAFGSLSSPSLGLGEGTIEKDPLFVEDSSFLSYEELNLHLAEGSPCIDAGVELSSDYIDPDGSAPDMGAYGGPNAFDDGSGGI